MRDELAWQGEGSCRFEDPELFFPAGEGKASQPQIAKAKAVCVFCPVKAACLRWALATGTGGIAGGTTEAERREMRRTVRRGAAAVEADGDAPESDADPDECALDPVAVDRALVGQKVDRPLTRDERVEVARRIRAEGGGYNRIMKTLKCNGTAAGRLIAEAEQPAPVAL